jgi:hypothetical protein
MVYPRYSLMFPSVKAVRDRLDSTYMADQQGVETKAQQLYASSPQSAIEYLNKYSNDNARQMLATWKNLATYLIVKYNDMTIKPEKGGKFARTPEGIGAIVVRPGYPEKYARELIKQTGDKFVYPEKKK